MKFNVGDKVKIVSFNDKNDISKGGEEILKGATGKIINIDTSYIYPYRIEFDDDNVQKLDCIFWSGEELELINMKREQWDICVDDDNVNILDWIQSHFQNENWHKNFEVTVTLREIDYVENEEGTDTERIYID
jgi:hypothetical protein